MTASGPEWSSGDMVPGTKYRVVRKLGAGGMGIVYQVIKPPQINGVLKLMSAELAAHAEFRTRFFDEVRVLAQLEHPNIVRVFDYDALANGTPYYVMELLNGRTVRDVLAAVGRVPPRVAFEVTRQLLEALHCAHTHDVPVVHRDIKPENIFLHAPRHGEPVVKLIDFGVVAVADRTHDGTFVGTWKYAAPEQIRGERATPATDLYAVGLVLYEMLAGCGPFAKYETGPAMATAHVHDVPAPVSTYAPWVPPSIVSLVSAALSKEPTMRPPDARAFAERLAELEWASDGEAPRDRARDGSPDGALSRVLTDVAAAGGHSPLPPAAGDVAPDSKHRGATLVGVGGASLPAANEAREPVPGAEASAKGVAPGTPPPEQAVRRPSPVAPDVAPVVRTPRAPEGREATPELEPDTLASSETDARRGSSTGERLTRIGLPLLVVAALASVALVALLAVRRRAEPARSGEPVATTTELGAPEKGAAAAPATAASVLLEPATTAATSPPASPAPAPTAVVKPARAAAARPVTAPPSASAAPPASAAPAPSSAPPRTDLLRQL